MLQESPVAQLLPVLLIPQPSVAGELDYPTVVIGALSTLAEALLGGKVIWTLCTSLSRTVTEGAVNFLITHWGPIKPLPPFGGRTIFQLYA